MRIALAIALFFAAQFAAIGASATRSEGDLAWQRWLGDTILHTHALPVALGNETFSAAGAAWVPQEWFFSILVALAMHAHLFALLAACVGLGAGLALALIAVHARMLGASLPATWLAVLFCGVAMEQLFGVRAQVAVWPLAGACLLLLDLDDARAFLAIAVAALWANLHASVMIAPVLALVRAGSYALDGGFGNPRVRRLALIALGSAAATLATPLGAHLPLYALALVHSPIRATILEWRTPRLGDLSFALGVLPLAGGTLAAMFATRRVVTRDLLFTLAMLGFALLAVRNMALASLAIAPLFARALTPLVDDAARTLALLRERRVAVLVTIAMLLGSALIAWRAHDLAERTSTPLPFAQIAAAARLHGTRHLYCEDFAWCSLALGDAHLRTFLDGRCDPFPLSVWSAYLAVQHDRARRFAILRAYAVDTVLADSRGRLARALRERRRWRVVAADGRYALFARE